MTTGARISGTVAAALVAGSPAAILAHPGHGAAVALHLHGWELAGTGLLALLVGSALTVAWTRNRDGG